MLPTRLVVLEPPSTPHRLDAYAVIKKQELEALSPLSRREDVVREFGKEVSKQLNVSEGTVKKITTFESPEKWIVENDQFFPTLWKTYGAGPLNTVPLFYLSFLRL